MVGKIFDSFIKMYFGDEDAFRKIGVANTYITVGCDRDSDVSTLIENVYTKLGKTVNRDKLERLSFFFFIFYFLFFIFIFYFYFLFYFYF